MRKLFIGMLSALILLGFSSSASAANEVKLLEVASYVQSYHASYTTSHFEALVANLGYTKQVNVHAQLSNGTWTDIPLTYNRAANNNLELWSTDVSDSGSSRFGSSIQFAVSYSVNGQTYWDNNNGANYVVPVNAGYILYNNMNVYNQPYSSVAYIYTDNAYHGAVTLKNLAYTKNAAVVYTTDGWATVKTASAVYSPNYWTNAYVSLTNPTPYGFEEWEYSLDVGSSATQVQFAISYTVNGQTYWDNNFGHNYVVSLIHVNR